MTSEVQADNGVNVAALLAAREALTEAPEGANFKWRATCTWKNGTHSHSTVEGFYGLGEEQKRKTVFSFDADHPEIFASQDKGATPVEMVLVGLASCLTAGVAAVAQNRGIQLRTVSLHNHCALADLKLNRLLSTFDAWAADNGVDGVVEPAHRPPPTRV